MTSMVSSTSFLYTYSNFLLNDRPGHNNFKLTVACEFLWCLWMCLEQRGIKYQYKVRAVNTNNPFSSFLIGPSLKGWIQGVAEVFKTRSLAGRGIIYSFLKKNFKRNWTRCVTTIFLLSFLILSWLCTYSLSGL